MIHHHRHHIHNHRTRVHGLGTSSSPVASLVDEGVPAVAIRYSINQNVLLCFQLRKDADMHREHRSVTRDWVHMIACIRDTPNNT